MYPLAYGLSWYVPDSGLFCVVCTLKVVVFFCMYPQDDVCDRKRTVVRGMCARKLIVVCAMFPLADGCLWFVPAR